MALNDSITLDVIKHCKNIYANLLSLYIASSYKEKIKWSDKLVMHSRLFWSWPSLKKASYKKDLFSSSPVMGHFEHKQFYFILFYFF